MNKHGQTLVFFVLLIPILLLFGAFVIDTSYLLKENTKLKSITRTIINEVKDEKQDSLKEGKIKELYEKNHIPTESFQLKTEENKQVIENTYTVKSIFGKIIGLKEYTVKIEAKLE